MRTSSDRKRRRSLSPYERDRYDPRPRYNDDYGAFPQCLHNFTDIFSVDAHSRPYGYSSPRRGGPYPPGPFIPSRRAPPDPHTFDYPSSLKQYAEWFRYFYPQQAIEEDNADKAAEQEAGDGSKPRNGIKSRWEKYKKEFSASQVSTRFHAYSLLSCIIISILLSALMSGTQTQTMLNEFVAANDV